MAIRTAIWVLVFCAALALRIPRLADRPMHADEAVLAAKLGEWLDGGAYRYDPAEHHGPALAWLAYPIARIVGAGSYVGLSENVLRSVAVLCGVLVILSVILLADGLGRWPAVVAAALLALSPGMVYYSRYFIPEMLLTALTGITIGCGYRYTRSGRLAWVVAAGVSAGLMLVTKETAVIVLACMAVAALCVPRVKVVRWGHIALGAAIAMAIPLVTFGFADIWEAVRNYAQKAVESGGHAKPWYYYLDLLARQEFAIVALAAIGIWRGPRFLTVYAVLLTFAYSVIPYKTPWCVLGPLYAMALVAASRVGLRPALRTRAPSARGQARRPILQCVTVVLAAAGIYQAWRLSYPLSSDARNPYAYAHTGRDVYLVRDAVDQFGPGVTIQVISGENLWPLPWYLRGHPNAGWLRRIEPGFRPADVILITPEIEPALVHQIYEVPPPGKRELYRRVFDRYVELRPGIELRMYVRASL